MFFCVSQRATTTNRLEVFSHTQSREIQLRQERKNLTRKWRCDFLFCLYIYSTFLHNEWKVTIALSAVYYTTPLFAHFTLQLMVQFVWWGLGRTCGLGWLWDAWIFGPATPSDERSDTDSVLGRRGGISRSHMHSVYPSVSLLFSLRFCFLFPGFVCVCVYTSVPPMCV